MADHTGAASPVPGRSIAEHGIIGNLDTAALVASDGTIDFLCWPHLDSPTIFAGLLDSEKGAGVRDRSGLRRRAKASALHPGHQRPRHPLAVGGGERGTHRPHAASRRGSRHAAGRPHAPRHPRDREVQGPLPAALRLCPGDADAPPDRRRRRLRGTGRHGTAADRPVRLHVRGGCGDGLLRTVEGTGGDVRALRRRSRMGAGRRRPGGRDRHRGALASLGRCLDLPRPLARAGDALGAGSQAPDLARPRLDRGRRDLRFAGSHRIRAQLGLPCDLAARRLLHRLRLHAAGLRGGGRTLSRLARRPRPRCQGRCPPEHHVCARRRRGRIRSRTEPSGRLRRRAPRARRQCRGGAASARHLRRTAGQRLSLQQIRLTARSSVRGCKRARRSTSSAGTGGTATPASGSFARTSGTCCIPGSCAGSRSTGR